jgi:enterochelin esterase family protein
MWAFHRTQAGLCVFTISLAACSSTPSETTNAATPGAGGNSTAGGSANTAGMTAGGTSGVATGGGAAGSTAGTSANGGAVNVGGGGAAVGGSGGSDAAGAGGTAGSGGAGGTTAPSTMGMQVDPGTEGDGTFDLPPPYDLQPESVGPVDGAPAGQLMGPMLYTQTGTYTDWDMWIFPYWVYVPAQYQPGHAAALMILNDGAKYIGDQTQSAFEFNTPIVFDNLIHEGSMPVTIGVFIGPGSSEGQYVTGGDGGRARQYDTANDQYGKFILEEFLPSEILPNWSIVTDADGWAMGGHSSGGNASFSAAWFYPDRFHKILTANATLGLTGLFPGALSEGPAKPIRIYLTSGSGDDSSFGVNNDAANNLEQLGYHYRYGSSEDVHAPPSAASSDYPDALRWLWRGYTAGQ